MGYRNGIIYQPVSIYDVQRCLGTSDNDLATLCMKSNINMWSDRKPIYSTNPKVLTSAEWQGGGHVIDDTGSGGYQTGGGIKKFFSGITLYLNGGSITDKVWTYDKPVLDGQCFFRLSDFAGYHHNIARMFNINTIFGQLSYIPIPSVDSPSSSGTNVAFTMRTNVVSGSITALDLLRDVLEFYPGVILTCSNGTYHYAKTASQKVGSLIGETDFMTTFTINTAVFASQIASDWRGTHSGDPYDNYPLRSNDNWCICMVLLSREFTVEEGSKHIINTTTDKIVRLEYASATAGVHVDRKILPIKQSKYNNIEWMKMTVKITKVSGYQRKY